MEVPEFGLVLLTRNNIIQAIVSAIVIHLSTILSNEDSTDIESLIYLNPPSLAIIN